MDVKIPGRSPTDGAAVQNIPKTLAVLVTSFFISYKMQLPLKKCF